MTGRPYSDFMMSSPKKRDFNIKLIAIDRERNELYDRINRRVVQMFDKGLEDEVRSLESYRKLPPLKTVGYKELFEYFDGKTDRQEAMERVQNNTRKYARKQITWFRKNGRYRWFHPDKAEEILKFIES